MGMGYNDAAMGAQGSKGIAQMIAGLPQWAQAIVSIAAVILIAMIAGIIIGKMYAMIKYPDPEKQSVISPKLKVAFICLLAVCCVWLYITMTKPEEPAQPAEDSSQTGGSAMGDAGGYMGGGTAMAVEA